MDAMARNGSGLRLSLPYFFLFFSGAFEVATENI
jgi:hypothetical protein